MKPNVRKMARKNDFQGLIQVVNNHEINQSIRVKAASELGRYNNHKVIQQLTITIMKNIDDEYLLQDAAAKALVKIGKPTIPYITHHLLTSPYSIVRNEGVLILSHMQDPSVVIALIQNLGDTNDHIRAYSAVALGNFNDNNVVIPLIEALDDSNEMVRECSAESLGKIKDLKAIPHLINKLKDTSDSVRKSAAGALVKLGDESIIEILKEGNYNDSARLLKFKLLANAIDTTKEVRAHVSTVKDKFDIDDLSEIDIAQFERDENILYETKKTIENFGDKDAKKLIEQVIQDYNETKSNVIIQGDLVHNKTAIQDSVLNRSSVGINDMTNELERLSNMMEKGLLTNDEFTSAKEKLLISQGGK